jgi:hypothetical protein
MRTCNQASKRLLEDTVKDFTSIDAPARTLAQLERINDRLSGADDLTPVQSSTLRAVQGELRRRGEL